MHQCECLIELHNVDIEAAGLNHIGKGEGYTLRQIDGWSQRYAQAKIWNAPSGNVLWLGYNSINPHKQPFV